MKIIEATNAGFFANLCDALRHIYIAERDGEEWYVNWGPESLYYDESVGLNAFDYFFEQKERPEFSSLHTYVRGYVDIDVRIKGYENDLFTTGSSFRNTLSRLINEHLKYKHVVNTKYNSIISLIDPGKTLGVHIRYTDKYNGKAFGEPASAEPIPLKIYIHLAQQCMKYNMYEHIYLATDCAHAAREFSQVFGSKLVMIQAPRSETNEPIHSGHSHISGFYKGLSVLLDALVLSRCDYLIRGTSNVSSFAQFIDTNLKHVNLNEVLMGDYREHQYGLFSSDYDNFL